GREFRGGGTSEALPRGATSSRGRKAADFGVVAPRRPRRRFAGRGEYCLSSPTGTLPMASAQRFDQPMLDLALIHVEIGTTVRSALHHVARVAVRALGLGRFSVWLATDDHEAVRLYYLHRPGRDDVIDGTILRVDQFPSYFAALGSARALDVADASTDPAVSE